MDEKRRAKRSFRKGIGYMTSWFNHGLAELYKKPYKLDKSKHTKRKISRGWVDGGMESKQGSSSGVATVAWKSWTVGKP